MKRPKALPDLLAMNRNAGTVYIVLRWLSGERRQWSTTRRRIADVCGLSEKRITDAMKALGECGWVTVNYGRHGIKTWYRLSFPVGGFLPVVRKTTHRGRKVVDKNDPQGTVPCGTENDPLSPKGDGTAYSPAPSPLGLGAERPPVNETRPERELRERLERERANRDTEAVGGASR